MAFVFACYKIGMGVAIETPSRIEPCLLDQISLAIVDLDKAGMAIDTAVAALDKASVAKRKSRCNGESAKY